MQWIAPPEEDTATGNLGKRLWEAADQFRANSRLKSRECFAPVLGGGAPVPVVNWHKTVQQSCYSSVWAFSKQSGVSLASDNS
jgi:hypothetical protein